MSRDDLLFANYEVVRTATEQAVKYSPNAILILVTNPLDAMCWTAQQVSGFSKNRVIGMAGVLDTARFRTFIAEELGVSFENVTAMVLGGHGDTMVPLVRLSSVSGIPLTELLDKADYRSPGPARPRRRRRNRQVSQDRQRILCSFGRYRRDGGIYSERQEEGSAVRGSA